MKKYRETLFALILVLATAASAAVLAQEASKNTPKKPAEASCSMECCKNCPCCGGDSCELKVGTQDQASSERSCCNGNSCGKKKMKNKKKQA